MGNAKRLTKPWIFLFFALALVLALGCWVKLFVFPSRLPVQIYYPEKNNLFLVPVTRWITQVTPEALLRELKKPPAYPGLLPALPQADSKEQLAVHGNELVITFRNTGFVPRNPMSVKALLATLKQIPNVETVRFVAGREFTGIANGIELGSEKLASFRVNDNFGAAWPGYKAMQEGQVVTIYYVLKGTKLLVPMSERVSTRRPVEEAIAETLEEPAPFSWAVSSALPSGSRILSVLRPSKGSIEIALSLSGSSEEKRLARKALLLTYTEIPSIRWVWIREKGKFWTGLCVSKRPGVINEEGGGG